MVKNQKGSSANHSTVLAKIGGARIQILHERLIADTDGKLSEVPELLVAVEMFREAVTKYNGGSLHVSNQPYIKEGEYRILIWLAESKQSDNEISNRYHALTENARHWYLAIAKNAELERPLSLKNLKVPASTMAILKALGKLGKLAVDIVLTTDDGQTSEFPRVDYKYLSASDSEVLDTKPIKHLVVGVDVAVNKQLLVHLEKSHWIRLEFSNFAEVCMKAAQGNLLVGTAEIIDGAWAMRSGIFERAPKNMDVPFKPIA